MRTIKYRGIAQGSNKFIYGLPGISGADGSNVIDLIDGEYIYFETLGQYIGMDDLNLKNAYDGDLIRYKYYQENSKKVIGIGKIYFDCGCYFLEDIKTNHKYPMYCASLSFEIIGNIHQDKNLLK